MNEEIVLLIPIVLLAIPCVAAALHLLVYSIVMTAVMVRDVWRHGV